jgi:hypothetical protein
MSEITPGLFDEYESRKAMFNASQTYGKKEEEGFRKGMEFELLWSLNKKAYYGGISAEEDKLIESMRKALS